MPVAKVSIQRTTTLTVANTVPTAASTGSDLNGMAAKIACQKIRGRLVKKAAELLNAAPGEIDIREGRVFLNGTQSELTWQALIEAVHAARQDLSAHGFYATPFLEYDMRT